MLKLLPHQEKSVEWLITKRQALLAHEMRVGKSAICVAAIDKLGLKSILIVCPAIARLVWQEQFDKFSKEKKDFRIIKGRDIIIPSLAVWTTNFYVIIVSYDILVSNFSEFKEEEWDVVICDEAHYLKNPEAKRTQIVLGKNGLIHKTKYFWALTGTPMPNHPAELWPLLFTLGRTKLTYSRFVDMFCEGYKTPYGFQVTGARQNMIEELKQLLQPIMLRYKRSEVMAELPPTIFEDILIEPSDVNFTEHKHLSASGTPPLNKQMFFQRMEKEKMLVEASIRMIGIGNDGIETLKGLWKSTTNLRMYTGVQKIKAVVDLVEDELENKAYEKIVLFAHHADVINGLCGGLKKFGAKVYYGKTDEATKRKTLKAFKENPKCQVLCANIQACGVAVDLSHCSQIIFVEQDWVPGNNEQAAARCHTIHNNQTVVIRVASIADSFDMKIARALKRKMRDALAVVG